MTERILLVDDEPMILEGLRRTLRKAYEYDTACGAEEGLVLLDHDDYAVIVSDMRMPGMTGDQFLARAHEVQPDAVLMILSGQADVSTTIAAVNNSKLHRFLVKPVDRAELTGAIDGALDQYRLVQAERELLEGTLSGAVSALTEVIGLTNPASTRRTRHVTQLIEAVAPVAGLEGDWQLRVTGLLSGIGYAAVPPDVMERAQLGQRLRDDELAMIERQGGVAMRLLEHIPRLEGVASIIGAQAGLVDLDAELAKRGRVLMLASETAALLLRGDSLDEIGPVLRADHRFPDEWVSAVLSMGSPDMEEAELPVGQLRPGMIPRQDIMSATDILLAAADHVLTEALLERISNFNASAGVREPIKVAFAKATTPEAGVILGGVGS